MSGGWQLNHILYHLGSCFCTMCPCLKMTVGINLGLVFRSLLYIFNPFQTLQNLYKPILTTVYWWLGRCTLIWARRGGENGWSLPVKLLLELGIGDVAPEDDGVVQGGLGSADDVEHVAGLLSKRNFSLFLNSVSLFFKSTYSLGRKSNRVLILVKCKMIKTTQQGTEK